MVDTYADESSCMQSLDNIRADGDFGLMTNTRTSSLHICIIFTSLKTCNKVITVNEELPAQHMISVITT